MRKLLLNFISRPNVPLNSSYPIFSDGNQSGVLQRVSSAAGMAPFLSLFLVFVNRHLVDEDIFNIIFNGLHSLASLKLILECPCTTLGVISCPITGFSSLIVSC